MFCTSCVVRPDGSYAPYGTYSVATNGYNTSVAWTNASYDANGFPIFGYSYGRPVYGYTEAGVAIFTVAALTALCFVPRWSPAPWYRGHWHYPPHCHRVAAPPRHPHGHAPHVRPHGGMNAPIHRNPGSVFNKHPKPMGHANRPGHNNMHRPNPGHANRPNNMVRPNPGHANRPNNMVRPNPGHANRPNNMVRPNPGHANRPNNMVRPNPGHANRPAKFSKPINIGSMNRPGASGISRPSVSHSRPMHNISRPTSSMGGMSRPSGGGRPGGRGR